MPNLKELLDKAKAHEAGNSKKNLTRGIRPDMVISDSFFEKKERSQNVVKTEPERSHKGGPNVVKTEPERSQNVVENQLTEPERSHKGGPNVVKTEPERSHKGGLNVAMKTEDPTLLVGSQRQLFEYFFNLSQNFASLKTPRLNIETISSATGLRSTQIHSATKNLRQKGCIVLSDRKDGRGGWVEYSVNSKAFERWIRLTNEQQRSQNVVKTEPERSHKGGPKGGPDPSSSSSSVFNINKETTTTQREHAAEISGIDLSGVQHLGITESVLLRCIELYPALKPDQLETLAHRFLEYTKDPKNKVLNARGFFISLAEQASRGLVPLDHIETSDERLLRLFIKQQKEKLAIKTDYEQEAQSLEFESWVNTLSLETKQSLVPETSLLKTGTGAHTAMLRHYFAENIWPEFRKKILSGEATL